MSEFRVPMRLTFNASVTVEAKDEAEARHLADMWDIADDGMDVAELVDWLVTGTPKKPGEAA